MDTNEKLWSANYNVYTNDLLVVNNLLIICLEKAASPVLNLDSLVIEFEIVTGNLCRSVDINKDETLLAIATDKNVILWDFENRKILRQMIVGDWPVQMKFNPGGNRLVVLLYGGDVIKMNINLSIM